MATQKSPILHITNATLQFDARVIWKKLTLDLLPGECIAVLGPNGSGKSSLIKAILGTYPLTSGQINVLGKPMREVRKHIGYIPQQKAFDADMPLSGRELVKLGVDGARWFMRPDSAQEHARINSAINEVGAAKYADTPLGRLSGGEQQRLRIAQALVSDPQLLLCDEPLLSLDLASQQAVASLIDERRKKGTAVLFVTHEINPILPMVDRILYIVNGKWLIGTPKEVLTSESLTALYGAPVEVLRVHGRIIVVSADEHTTAEPMDAHHHLEAHA